MLKCSAIRAATPWTVSRTQFSRQEQTVSTTPSKTRYLPRHRCSGLTGVTLLGRHDNYITFTKISYYSTRMAADQNEFQSCIPARQSQAGDSSEYYGIPLRNTKGYAEMLYTGQSQPTSPTRKSARYNYEALFRDPTKGTRTDNHLMPKTDEMKV